MKNTINKSEIFKVAWNYVKKNNWTLSASLKVAWKEAKEGTNNDAKALSSLIGSSFYTAYLLNGNTITMFQYQDDYYLLDNDMRYINTNMQFGGKYDKEASKKGYKNDVEMFKAEGHKIEFKA